jgi:hypothetical protein
MFHIFRNTPFGRENLRQSIFFCQRVKHLRLTIYHPTSKQCAIYFDGSVVTLDLDKSYTDYPETAAEHIEELMGGTGVEYELYTPTSFTAGSVPELPTNWSVMACPRAIVEQTGRIGLGHIGPKVRSIVKHAQFPVFIPSLCFREWNRVAAFFGGSDLGVRVVNLAVHVSRRAHVPLTIYTQLNGETREAYERSLATSEFGTRSDEEASRWITFDSGSFQENLYAVDADSLVMFGAGGDSLMRELVFGSKLETIQNTLPNPALVVGPQCKMQCF